MTDYASLRAGGSAGPSFLAFVERLEGLLDDPTYRWAYDTISGIHDDVVNKTRFTEAQEQAISNIENSSDLGFRRRRCGYD